MSVTLSKLYHFVAKEEMFNRISELSNQQELNFSKTMRLIVNTMMPLLDYYVIFENESTEFGYNKFGAEVDVRFYIEPDIYRKLKNAHGAMHTFSVSVLIRKMIELFFIIVDAKGLDWLINAMKYGIKKIINILNKNRRFFKNTENVVHMYGEDLMEVHIAMIFSKNYTLIGVEKAKKSLLSPHKLFLY